MGPEQVLGGTDEEFIANVYYAVSAGIVADAARVLGDTRAEEHYRALSREQFDIVKQEYYSATGRCCIKTQTALILTLKYHLSDNVELTKAQLKKLFEYSKGKLRTGFVGTPLLCNVLSANGMDRLAWDLLLNEEFPGWLREVKLGATTVWERWNSLNDDGSISGIKMNSMNHYAYGSVLEWVFRYAAGMQVTSEAPGVPQMRIAPVPDWRVGHVHAWYDSPSGRYESSWEMPDENHIKVRVTVPFGCSAFLTLPDAPEEIYKDQSNSMFAEVKDHVCHLKPGTYEVSYQLSK